MLYGIDKIGCRDISEQKGQHLMVRGMVQSRVGSLPNVWPERVTNSAGRMSLQEEPAGKIINLPRGMQGGAP